MPPRLGLYSLANTPEELLSQGYGMVDTEFAEDPAFGDLAYNTVYNPAPYTGDFPFQNVFRINEGQYYGDLDFPSFGGVSGYRDTGGITGIEPVRYSADFDTSYGVANEEDEEQVDYLPGQKKSFKDSANLQEYFQNRDPLSGIMKVLRSIPSPTNLLLNMLPKPDPRETNIRNFYGNQYGLTSTGSIDSGIMRGYNPVYGSNFLNKLTGGRLPPRSFGLADAARRRIENIATRRAAQTAASRAKIEALQKFAERDTISRARFDNQNVYSKAEANKALGPGGGFSTSGSKPGTSLGSGQFKSSSNPRGRKDY